MAIARHSRARLTPRSGTDVAKTACAASLGFAHHLVVLRARRDSPCTLAMLDGLRRPHIAMKEQQL